MCIYIYIYKKVFFFFFFSQYWCGKASCGLIQIKTPHIILLKEPAELFGPL